MPRISFYQAALLAPLSLFATEFEGFLEPGRRLHLSTPEAGIIRGLYIREGEKVDSGEVLLELDSSVLMKDLNIISEEYSLLDKRVRKLKELRNNQFASEDELFRAQGELSIIGLKRARLEALVERRRLRSPIEGVITELRFDLGEGVSGPSSHLATVVDLDPLHVQFALPLAYSASLKEGDALALNVQGVEKRVKAEVIYVSPVSTAVVNTVRVKLSIPNPAGTISSGLRCTLTLDKPYQIHE